MALQKNPFVTNNAIRTQLFPVAYNYLDSRSKLHLQLYGVRISEVESIDRRLATQEIETEISVERMFDLYRQGVTVKLRRYNDAGAIYRVIRDYILAWVEHLQNHRAVNVSVEPIAELVELDDFSKIVYSEAVNVFSEEERKNIKSGKFTFSTRVNFNTVLSGHRKKETHASTFTNDGIEIVTIKRPTEKGPAELPAPSYRDLFMQNLEHFKRDPHGK